MAELFEISTAWQTLLFVVLVFGFAPGFLLRLIVRIYPRNDPRRAELIAELYAMPRRERPLFVAEQLETVLFDGLPSRVAARRRGRRRVVRDEPTPRGLGAFADMRPQLDLVADAIRDGRDIAVRVGVLVIIKVGGTVTVRPLTVQQHELLAREPHLVDDPPVLFARLVELYPLWLWPLQYECLVDDDQ